MLSLGVPALKIISISFFFPGISIIIASTCQALGKAFYSLVISLVRQLVFILPLAWLFVKLWGLTAVWFAFPVSEALALIPSLFFLWKVQRKIIQTLSEDRRCD